MSGDKKEKRKYESVEEKNETNTLTTIFGKDPRVYLYCWKLVKEVFEELKLSSTYTPDEDQEKALNHTFFFNMTLNEKYNRIDKHDDAMNILDSAIVSLTKLLTTYNNRGTKTGIPLRRRRVKETGEGLDTTVEVPYDEQLKIIVTKLQNGMSNLLTLCLNSRIVSSVIPGTKGLTGARDDGKFYISFIRMGQGDCTVFKTPEGEVGIIDCGSKKPSRIGEYLVNKKTTYTEPNDGTPMTSVDFDHYNNYASNKKNGTHTLNTKDEESSAERRKQLKEILKRPEYLGTNDVLNYLILTHKDEDHCNEFGQIIDEFTLTNVFHSDDLRSYPIDEKIRTNGTNSFNVRVNDEESAAYIQNKDTKKPWTQVLEEDQGSSLVLSDYDWGKVTANPDDAASTKKRKTLPALNKKYPIKSNVRIVASDIKKGDTNASSVVTLIELFNSDEDRLSYQPPLDLGDETDIEEFKEELDNAEVYRPFLKVIICGDSTFDTENFMIERYERNKILSDIDIIQVPHHGSRETSSSEAFVKMIHKKDAMIAVISAGKHIAAHHHPQAPVVQTYESYTRSKFAPHYSWVWSQGNVEYLNAMYNDIYVLGSNGHRHFSVEKKGDPL